MVLNNLPCLKRVCWKVARCARLVINEASGGLWRRDFGERLLRGAVDRPRLFCMLQCFALRSLWGG